MIKKIKAIVLKIICLHKEEHHIYVPVIGGTVITRCTYCDTDIAHYTPEGYADGE